MSGARELPDLSDLLNRPEGETRAEEQALRVAAGLRADDFVKMDRSFSAALKWAKEGKRIAREGWNGKGMWVGLQRPYPHSMISLPYLYIRTADGHIVPWVTSQFDLLAEDWVVVP